MTAPSRFNRATLPFIVATAISTAFSASAWAEPEVFDGLYQEMSSSERDAAGLDSLSASERAFLDGWLRKRFGALERKVEQAEAAAVQAEAKAAEVEAEFQTKVAAEVRAVRAAEKAEDKAEADKPFDATLLAPFTGWSGKTKFRLPNGQVWQQRSSSNYRHTDGSLDVHFEQNFLGLWEMKVLSTGRSVGVKRVE